MPRTSRVLSKRFYLVSLALAIFLSGESSPAAQQMRSDERFLVLVLLRTQTLRDQVEADLEDVEMELQRNGLIIQEAERKLAIALETRNRQAKLVPENDLLTARAARGKIKKARARLQLARARAEASYATTRKMLVSGQITVSNSQILGMVSLYSGRVDILKKDGRKIGLNEGKFGLFGSGDEVLTNGASRAEVQALDGRGTVQLGKQSRLKLEEDTPQEQILRFVQGKMYAAVDKPEDLEKILQDRMEGPDDDLNSILKRYQGLVRSEIVRFFKKNLEMRIPAAVCTVRGARFSVEVKHNETTEISVLEGAVEVRDLKGQKYVLVEEGFRAIVTKDGISEPQRIIDIEKWWEK